MQGAHAVCACRVHNLGVGAQLTCTALAHAAATCTQQITLVLHTSRLLVQVPSTCTAPSSASACKHTITKHSTNATHNWHLPMLLSRPPEAVHTGGCSMLAPCDIAVHSGIHEGPYYTQLHSAQLARNLARAKPEQLGVHLPNTQHLTLQPDTGMACPRSAHACLPCSLPAARLQVNCPQHLCRSAAPAQPALQQTTRIRGQAQAGARARRQRLAPCAAHQAGASRAARPSVWVRVGYTLCPS